MITAQPGESKPAFLRRLGAGPGAVDPDVIPYYLLLVGEPDQLTFGFQYQLDVAYAVGRVAFDDFAGYAAYAANVVRAEQRVRAGPATLPSSRRPTTATRPRP